MSTTDNRSKAADAALADYQWGEGVNLEGTSGWEHDSGSLKVHCTAFVATAEQVGDEDSIRLRFTVLFDETGEVVNAWATGPNGDQWGRAA